MSLRTKCGLAQSSLACFLWPPPVPPAHQIHTTAKSMAPSLGLWMVWGIGCDVDGPLGYSKGTKQDNSWPDGTAAGQGESQALVHTKLSRGRWPPTWGASGSSLASAGILGKADGLQVVSRHSQVSPGHSGDALSSSPLPGLLLIPFLVSFYWTTFQTSRVPFVNFLPF